MSSLEVLMTYKNLLTTAYNFYRIAFPEDKVQAKTAFYTIAANSRKDLRMNPAEHVEIDTHINRNCFIPKDSAKGGVNNG